MAASPNARYLPRLDRLTGQHYIPQAPPWARAAGFAHIVVHPNPPVTPEPTRGVAALALNQSRLAQGLSTAARARQFASQMPAGVPGTPSAPFPAMPVAVPMGADRRFAGPTGGSSATR